jgi:hypothetical protein
MHDFLLIGTVLRGLGRRLDYHKQMDNFASSSLNPKFVCVQKYNSQVPWHRNYTDLGRLILAFTYYPDSYEEFITFLPFMIGGLKYFYLIIHSFISSSVCKE